MGTGGYECASSIGELPLPGVYLERSGKRKLSLGTERFSVRDTNVSKQLFVSGSKPETTRSTIRAEPDWLSPLYS